MIEKWCNLTMHGLFGGRRTTCGNKFAIKCRSAVFQLTQNNTSKITKVYLFFLLFQSPQLDVFSGNLGKFAKNDQLTLKKLLLLRMQGQKNNYYLDGALKKKQGFHI